MTSDHTPESFDDVAAWALDALDDADRRDVEASIEADDALRHEADRMQRVVALLGEGAAAQPSAAVRDALLSSVRDRPPSSRVVPTPPCDLFAHQVEALVELLDTLDADQWRAGAEPYDWTVQGLVAHLLVIERYMAGLLGFDAPAVSGPHDDHLGIGSAEIEAALGAPAAETAHAWAAQARSTVEQLQSAGEGVLERQVVFHQWPFDTTTLLVARSFEVWTHADDIRRAIGMAMEDPRPSDIRTMSTMAVNSLPVVLPLVAPSAPIGSARVVLTGDGGGTFDLARNGDTRTVTIVTDVVDYCRLAARRIGIGELDATVEGDFELASGLFRAARVFAV